MCAVGARFKRSRNNPRTWQANPVTRISSGPLLDGGLEVGELDVILVNRHLTNAASLEETGDPIKAVGGEGSASASESITLVSKGPGVSVPSRNSVWGRNVALGWLAALESGGVGQGHKDKITFTYSIIP